MDLIYEGITTAHAKCQYFTLVCQNGPDLRRDYDLAGVLLFHIFFGHVRMDLIYEGITTVLDWVS